MCSYLIKNYISIQENANLNICKTRQKFDWLPYFLNQIVFIFIAPREKKFNKWNLFFSFFSRQSGHKVGPYLEQIIPVVVTYSKVENDDELRETCIQVFSLFLICRHKCVRLFEPEV